VKIIKADRERFSFQFEPVEKEVLFKLVSLYPLIPVAHFRRHQPEAPTENQLLLEASLKVQREENRKAVQKMMDDATFFRPVEGFFECTLSPGQMEWLLQVLNDINVGSWLALGSPDNWEQAEAALDEKSMPYYVAHQTAMRLQGAFLYALNASQENNPPAEE
jgi:hypothetical protein